MSTRWTHPVRARLAAGERVVAITLTTPSIETAAHAASLGFDVLWVEMEHSPITLESLRGIVLATRALPAAVFARVPANELWMAKRVLDQGVSGVIFPFTSTAEMAGQAVAACRYPPHGRRGSGAGLAKATWPDADDYYDSADANVMVVTVVEDRAGLENIDAIAATPGLDVIFIGTSDLAFSLGLRGDMEAPEVEQAVAQIAEAAKRNGKVLGRPAVTPEKVSEYMQKGFQFFQAPTELGLLSLGAKAWLEVL